MANKKPHWPFRPTPNGHQPPETGGHLKLLQRELHTSFVVLLLLLLLSLLLAGSRALHGLPKCNSDSTIFSMDVKGIPSDPSVTCQRRSRITVKPLIKDHNTLDNVL